MTATRPSDVSRRRFLAGGVGVAATVGALGPAAVPTAAPASAHPYFLHGVASGDPLPDAVVLWTRVTPEQSATPGSGRGEPVDVRWEVARGDDFADLVAAGTVRTDASRDHTVKVDATGLEPGTDYVYRFVLAGAASPVGRTRTAPRPDDVPRRLRLGVVSCANWEAGYFSAYRHLLDRDLDAVVHLGDYLYEYEPGRYAYGHGNQVVRPHHPPHEVVTLADYRARHGQYKTDRDLQALHAAVPFVVTWDDHEVADGWWADGAFEHGRDEGAFADRRRSAKRAYDEWMPVRLSGTAAPGDGTRLYRSLRFGGLVELMMLDLRSHRSRRLPPGDPAMGDAGRTITGEAQGHWLVERLRSSGARWKLVGNPVMVAPVQLPPRPPVEQFALVQTVSLTPLHAAQPNTDEWDGYPADRARLLAALEEDGVDDVVFLTGDVHSAWASEVAGESGAPVATELVCSSVTSNNVDDFIGARPRSASLVLEAALQQTNPHVRHVNLDDHGFSVLDVTATRARMDWFAVSDRADPEASASRVASWEVPSGAASLRAATGGPSGG